MPVAHEAVEAFEAPPVSNAVEVWQLAGSSLGKAPQLRHGAPIPPRLRISEKVSALPGRLNLRAAYLPAWPAVAGLEKRPATRDAVVAIAPKPRVWMRSWTAIRQGPGLCHPADVWAQVRNSYAARQKIRAENLSPAAHYPHLRAGSAGTVTVLPLARQLASFEFSPASELPRAPKLTAQAGGMTTPQISLPGNLLPHALRPDIALTRGFLIWTKTPNSYARRSQPGPRLDLCERVIVPQSARPAPPRRTIKESDIPADQQGEITRPRHASRSL